MCEVKSLTMYFTRLHAEKEANKKGNGTQGGLPCGTLGLSAANKFITEKTFR